MANSVDLFSYLPGIQISENELLEAELLCQQILQAEYPDMDLREGTGLRDLVIRPGATLLALINKALIFSFAQNTIKGVTDTTVPEFVDKIMSNWFLTRQSGDNAVINVRLFFARQKNISIPQDNFFSTDNDKKFFPASTITILAADLTFDPYNNEYFIDVDLTAEESGIDYNITTGSLLYFSTFDPYFLRGEINYLKSSAKDSETNTEFIARAETAISTRNLINNPSIISKLLDSFTMLEGVTPIGMGDIEMLRDEIMVTPPTIADPIWIHNGGMMDIYCRLPLTSSIVQFTTDSSGQFTVSGPVYKMVHSQTSGGDSADTLPYLLTKTTTLTRSGSTVTATCTSHGYTDGQSVTISGANETDYNGTFTIVYVDPNTFRYTITTTPTSPATGTITSGIPYPYTVTNPNLLTKSVTSITRSSGIATVTVSNHGYIAGRYVTISGAGQAEYNGDHKIIAVTRDTFTFAVSGTPTTPATGTITSTFVVPYKDYGFSVQQTQVIDFGISQANKTVSFELYYFQNIDGIQDYLYDPTNRVLCGDPLARGYNIYLVDVSIVAYNSVTPSAATALTVVDAYLKSLRPGEIFVMADLQAKLFEVGIKTIQTPIGVNYTFYNKDLITPITGTITDTFNPNDATSIFIVNNVTTSSTNA